MSAQIVWQSDSNNPKNPEHLALITQWWEKQNLVEITWQQRIIPPNGELSDIDWNPQRFDEKLTLKMPQIRGITLYWYKSTSEDERNTTPRKLILDITKGELYIYPASQPQLVIRVSKPQIVYQTIELNNPLIAASTVDDNYVVLMRDKQQQLQVKVTLSADSLHQLLDSLPKDV